MFDNVGRINSRLENNRGFGAIRIGCKGCNRPVERGFSVNCFLRFAAIAAQKTISGVFASCYNNVLLRNFRANALINPVPNVSALEMGDCRVKGGVPEFIKVACRVAHRVSVLAHNHRFGLISLAVIDAIPRLGIHRAVNIGFGRPAGAFVMNWAARVALTNRLVTGDKVAAVSGFVTH